MEGEIHQAAGNSDKALASYRSLKTNAKSFGASFELQAIAAGSLGEANILFADGKASEAVPLLREALIPSVCNATPKRMALLQLPWLLP